MYLHRPLIVGLVILFISHHVVSQTRRQRFRHRDLQVSFVPGLSTNGINSGWYYNAFSVNLLAGISAGSKYFEMAGISNLSLHKSTGIQIAGVSNVVGANAFYNLSQRQERDLIVEEEFRADFSGFQIAGLVNYVRNDLTGLQLSLGMNTSGGSTEGLQLAGVGNVTNDHLVGLQIGGLYNVSYKSVGGGQLSLLVNVTRGPMAGVQLGVFNTNNRMYGKRNGMSYVLRSYQLGLVNRSRDMVGTQIGLINFAKEMGGTQIGLINVFSTGVPKNAIRNGVPIGLINIGSKGGFTRISSDETFLTNIETSTGNCGNCSNTQFGFPLNDQFQKFNQNILSFSYNPEGLRDDRGHWAVGYKFERINYVSYTMAPKRKGPQNKSWFWAWNAGVRHINWTSNWEWHLNLLTTMGAKYGKSFRLLGSHYLFAGVTLNGFVGNSKQVDASLVRYTSQVGTTGFSLWPGYEIGIQL